MHPNITKKIIVLTSLLSFIITFSGCKTNNDNPIIIDNRTPYEDIYHSEIDSPYPEGHNSNVYKAMYGYTLMDIQGYNSWYYQSKDNGTFENMIYNNENDRWESSQGYIDGAIQYANNNNEVAKTFFVQEEGLLFISGNIKVINEFNGKGNYAIALNGEIIYPLNNDYGSINGEDLTGYYAEIAIDVIVGDEIQFITKGDGELYWNPTIEYNEMIASPIHYDLSYDSYSGEHIGDVHPYYYDGQLYMYYLGTDGLYSSKLITSTNFIQYEEQEIFTHMTNPPVTDSYYVLGVLQQQNGLFRSYFGFSSTVINSSISDDLITWSEGKGVDDSFVSTFLPLINYPLGGRDPYVFYDHDIDRYRVIYLGYYENKYWENGGEGMDAGISITTSTDDSMEYWEENQKELLRFDNAGASERDELEVPQMIKIGDRWYIFGSIYGRSENGVGRTSYWKGEADTLIDDEDWNSKTEQFLTGDDLCAGQIVQVGNRYYIYGWIPYLSHGSWGGTLNIAREVYQLPNGDLGTRLDPYMTNLLNRGKIYSLGDGFEIEISGDWNITSNTATIETQGDEISDIDLKVFSKLELPGEYDRNLITLNLSIDEGSSMAGVILDNSVGLGKYYIYIDKVEEKLFIKTLEAGGLMTKGEIELTGIDYENMEIKIIAEGSIVEVFINNRYSLVSKICNFGANELDNYTISLFGDGENVTFSNLYVNKLSSYENIYD